MTAPLLSMSLFAMLRSILALGKLINDRLLESGAKSSPRSSACLAATASPATASLGRCAASATSSSASSVTTPPPANIVVSEEGANINVFGARSSFPAMEINATVGTQTFAIYRGNESPTPLGLGIFGTTSFDKECTANNGTYTCQ